MMSADKETRAEYLARVQQQNDIISGQTTSYKEGLREGEAKGLKKGKEIGKKQSALEIAKNLLALHLSLKEIAQIVRLPLAELEELKR